MATTQLGFLGRTGPTFIDDSTVAGKKIVLQGRLYGGVMKIAATSPAYAQALGLSDAPGAYTLGPYTDNQVIGDAPAYTQPATGVAYDAFLIKDSSWVSPSGNAGLQSAGSSAPATGGGSPAPSGGGTPAPTGGGTPAPAGNDNSTVTYQAATIGEQISTFLSSYWYVVVILALLLLWNPVIAPALGMKPKRKRSYR